jgi:hypothetical protein
MSDEAVPSTPAVVRPASMPAAPHDAPAVPLNVVGNKLWSFRA